MFACLRAFSSHRNAGSNPNCDHTNSLNQKYLHITPRIYVQGGPPNYYRLVLSGNEDVTDAKGDNPGWHTFCGPLGPLDSDGNFPVGGNATWSLGQPCDLMSGFPCPGNPLPEPEDAWCDVWSNVDNIQLPIDPTPNPAVCNKRLLTTVG